MPITTPAAKDPDWIPVVAQLGWVIITRDRRIQDKPAEIEAVQTHGAKMVNLASAEAGTTWAQLEVFMTQWRRIGSRAESAGPFVYIAGRTAFRPLDLS